MDLGNLDYQPMFYGSTNYCEPSFHLANHPVAGSPALEMKLSALNKVGPMLGTKMSYGKKRRSRYGKHRKRYGRKRRYGSKPPYTEGKLSTSFEDIGLPYGSKSPVTIFNTEPNMMTRGAPLPRPYGPRDNLRMQSLYQINGFGKVRRSRRRKASRRRRKQSRKKRSSKLRSKKLKSRSKRKRSRKLKKRRKKRSRSQRRRRRSFGMTPGTKPWTKTSLARNELNAQAAKYANPGALKTAKGLFASDIDLMVPSLGNKQYLTPDLNEPFQFSNNKLNTPVLNFGRRRRFGGALKGGPNTVAYQKPIPMYHAGGTTIDFATNQLYSPEGLVPKIGKVQPDGMTPNAWLTRSNGIGDGLGGTMFRFGGRHRKKKSNKPRKVVKKPSLSKPKASTTRPSTTKPSTTTKHKQSTKKPNLSNKKKKYGSVYTPDGLNNGSGFLSIKQPKPSNYQEQSKPKKVTGNFMSYGKTNEKLPKKKLKTNFGGKTISLDSSGKISIS